MIQTADIIPIRQPDLVNINLKKDKKNLSYSGLGIPNGAQSEKSKKAKTEKSTLILPEN